MLLHVRRSEDNLRKFSFQHVGARGQTQVIRLDGKCLYSMSLHQDGCGGGEGFALGFVFEMLSYYVASTGLSSV